MTRTGVLLINLGTPESPEVGDVRAYLRQFLMDPFVVDIPFPARWLLVNAIILPRRPKASAALYRRIWTERGSPLLFHSMALAEKLQRELGDSYSVRLGMRYGKPSIESALRELTSADKGVERLLVLPLYPQYSSASTESSVVEFKRAYARLGLKLPCSILGDFFDHPGFIRCFAEQGRREYSDFKPDLVIFSFHGLPERQIRKDDPSGQHCLEAEDCCERLATLPHRCYRHQCFQTARRIASEMELEPGQFRIGFQSRLGRTPWIRPYTDHLYDELAKTGVKRLLVMSPSFVADCLETLEEIQLRGREQFRQAGGEDLRLVPSLNSGDAWVQVLGQLVTAGRPH